MASRLRLLRPQGHAQSGPKVAAQPAAGLGELARSIGTGRVARSIDTRGEHRAVEIYGNARENAVIIVTRPSGIVRRPAWADWVAEKHAGAPEEIEP
jgi:hypothetical protein